MNAKLIELAERRTTLVARAATQRVELSQTLAPWRGSLAMVDRGLGGGALHQESCCAAGGGSGLRGAASSLALGEMAAAGLAGVAYGRCGEANPAWLVSSISRLPPGLGYKILDMLIGIAKGKRLDNVSSPLRNVPSKFALQLHLVGELISGFVTRRGTFNLGTLERNRTCFGPYL